MVDKNVTYCQAADDFYAFGMPFWSFLVFSITIPFLRILHFPPPQVARAGKCKIHKNSKTVIKNTKNGHDDITNASKIVRRGQKPPQKISTHLIPTP